MNLSGNTFVALAADGRLFGLDPQLLFDAAVTAVNVFILFLLLTFILFNPVRNMLKKRQDKITSDRENAENDKKEAGALKAEYEAKLRMPTRRQNRFLVMQERLLCTMRPKSLMKPRLRQQEL